jgi:two-component system sensor histidine kinase/response regulator
VRLLRMTENYLVYARVSVALNDPEERAVFRAETVGATQELITQHAVPVAERYNRKADLEFCLQPTKAIYCNYTHFAKVVEELVDNACKFSEPNKRITLTTALEPPHYVLYVQDEGRGISPEHLSQVGAYMQFDRWFYEQQGTGLGLGIVVQIVRLHDGIFDIQSTVGSGTRVKVGLRIASS